MTDATDKDDLDLDDKVDTDLQDDAIEGGEGAKPSEMSEKEKRARRLGWVPESEWDEERAEREGRRKPSKFISADEFIERTEDNIPIMRDQLRRVDAKLTDAESKINDMHGVILSQREMTKAAVLRAREQGRRDAEQAMRDAVVEGDTDKYDAAKEKLKEIDAIPLEEAKPAAAAKPQADPEAQRWADQNPWFYQDHELNVSMIAEHGRVKKANPDMPQWEQFEKAKRTVMRRFPEKFNINPRRDAPSAVSQPSGARQNDGSKSFDSIPRADQEAYEKHRKMMAAKGVKYTKEEFMADYAL